MDLGENGGRHVLNSVPEIKAWIQKEASTWQWFLGYGINSNSRIWIHQQQFRHLSDQISNIVREIERKTAQQPPQPISSDLHSIRSILINEFSQYLLHSESTLGKFVLEHKESVAHGAYLYSFMRRKNNTNLGEGDRNTHALDAYFEAQFYERGIKRSIKPADAALNEMRSRWEADLAAILEDLRTTAIKRKEDFDTLEKSIQQDKTDFKNSFDSLFAAEKETATKQNTNAKNEFEAIIKRFQNEMALKAPVTYWSRKAIAHRILAVVPVLFTGLLGYGLYALYPLLEIKKIQEKLLPADPHGYGNLLVVGVGFTLIIWILRILVRLFLSQLHLATEASEKKVTVLTFLALLGEKAIDTTDKELVLAAIFRPSSTGIVNEDGGPGTFWEMIGKIVGGKGS